MLSPYSTAFIDNSLKRKAETCDAKLSSPPNKQAKLELNQSKDLTEFQEFEKEPSNLSQEFGILYWKEPLQDIAESELNKIIKSCHQDCHQDCRHMNWD